MLSPGGRYAWRGLLRLSTPVAYVANIPYDPFQNEKSGEGSRGPLTYEMASTGCTGRQPLGWALASTGPNRIDDFGPGIPIYPAEILVVTIYDPTNGTVSPGDIVRFGPGPFNDKIIYR
jgi:hypothetical protein